MARKKGGGGGGAADTNGGPKWVAKNTEDVRAASPKATSNGNEKHPQQKHNQQAKAKPKQNTASAKEKARTDENKQTSPKAKAKSKDTEHSPSPKGKAKAKEAAKNKQGREDKSPSKQSGSTNESKEIQNLRAKLKEKRETIGMLRSPIRTLVLMVHVIKDYAIYTWRFLVSSLVVKLIVIPIIAAWFASRIYLPELHQPPPSCPEVNNAGILWQVGIYIKEAAWWIFLGILSSVGFGTGLHSGIMFLFPHIMTVVFASESCGTLDGLITLYQHPCKLDCSTTTSDPSTAGVTFLAILSRVAAYCMLWGLGTAIGELPPYAVSKAARLAGRNDEDFQQELEDAKGKRDPISVMKVWTIGFTEKYGFIGVLLLSAWPNAAFDMCGMCCGYLLMPFWTFFIAVVLGKGFIKVNGQAIFFILLFGRTFFDGAVRPLAKTVTEVANNAGWTMNFDTLLTAQRDKIIKLFEKQARYSMDVVFGNKEFISQERLQELHAKFGTPAEVKEIAERVMTHWDENLDGQISRSEIQGAVSSTDDKISLGSLDPSAASWVSKAWELCIVGLVCFFLVSIIDQLSAAKQQELDEATIQAAKRGAKKKK